MFFIGIFGINERQKALGTYNNAICPSCGAMTRYEIFKTYSYFHIFFIPTFRWNRRYYAQAACCGILYELDPAVGEEYERGMKLEIRQEHLHPIHVRDSYRICSNCRAQVNSGYSYCPHCGRKL